MKRLSSALIFSVLAGTSFSASGREIYLSCSLTAPEHVVQQCSFAFDSEKSTFFWVEGHQQFKIIRNTSTQLWASHEMKFGDFSHDATDFRLNLVTGTAKINYLQKPSAAEIATCKKKTRWGAVKTSWYFQRNPRTVSAKLYNMQSSDGGTQQRSREEGALSSVNVGHQHLPPQLIDGFEISTMALKSPLPTELEAVREKALRAIRPLKPLVSSRDHDSKTPFLAQRTKAGQELPSYYLVYFLLVDLFGFPHAGKWEKTAWSVAVDWHGLGFLIEHRKMGLGVFVQDVERDEAAAREIVIRIKKAVRAAQPFFDWLAGEAVSHSEVNVVNKVSSLYGRYVFLRDSYRSKSDEYVKRKTERVVTQGSSPGGGTWTQVSFPALHLIAESNWLAISAVEAFFAWTEHIFIHVALMTGKKLTATDVTEMAEADWSVKFQSALDLTDSDAKTHYDRLISLRKELRNYVAHGAFGKQGEAFFFHSGAGAVPVLLPHKIGSYKFKLAHGLSFDVSAAFSAMDDFITYLWSGERAPAERYIQQTELPLILPYVHDGTYSRAMNSVEDMEDFVHNLSREFDRSADMDW